MNAVIAAVISLLAGIIFGIGLLIGGMTQPQNIIAFLDVAGHWNPQLAFVMGGAVIVAMPAFAYARRKHRTLFGAAITLPDRKHLTPSLVIGSAIFGIGWGLSGLCPGPAIVLVGNPSQYILFFVASLAAGRIIEAAFFNKHATQEQD